MSWKRLKLSAALALLSVSVVTADAAAFSFGESVAIQQQSVDPAGDPAVSAGGIPIFEVPMDWQRCPPGGGACEPLQFTGNILMPGETAPGTTFKVNVSGQPDPEILTTREWGGRLAVSKPAAVGGEPTVGGLVRAQRATWSGGWPELGELTTLFACKTPKAPLCDELTRNRPLQPEIAEVLIAPQYEGWWLYAVSTHLTGGEVFPASVAPKIQHNPTTVPRVTKSNSAPAGPIKRNRRYRITVLRTPRLSRRRAILAIARCPSRCEFRARINIHPRIPSKLKPGESGTIVKSFDADGALRVGRNQIKHARYIRVSVYDRGVSVGGGVTRPRRP